MKGSLSRLLCALLAVSSAHAKVHTGKTYLLPRSQGVSLEKEYVTWHKQLSMPCEDRIGGSIQITPFYQDSSNIKDAGKYFGRTKADVDQDWIGVKQDGTEGLLPSQVFHISDRKSNGTDAITDYATHVASYQTLFDQVEINPDSKSVGARFDYHQKLDALLDGLFFKVSVPVVNNKTSVHAKSKGTAVTQKLVAGLNADMTGPLAPVPTGKDSTFLDYLAGNVSSDDVVNAQVALSKAKVIAGSHNETGVADVAFAIGYNFLNDEDYRVGLNLGVTFPTGTKPDGEFLYGQRVGTNHWGLGVGFEAGVNVWSSDSLDLEMMLVANYCYLFKDKEMRTPGMSGAAGNDFLQYALGDKDGALAGDKFFPLANKTTVDYDVTPGSQFEMLLNVALTWSGFTFDLGYNLYYRDAEIVELREYDAKIGLASTTAAANRPTEATNRPAPTLMSEENFKATALATMATPSQLTNKVYAGVGYAWNEWEYPVLLGVFGGYEFSENNACEQWSVGGKVGVTF
jgi:hypothetical protein